MLRLGDWQCQACFSPNLSPLSSPESRDQLYNDPFFSWQYTCNDPSKQCWGKDIAGKYPVSHPGNDWKSCRRGHAELTIHNRKKKTRLFSYVKPWPSFYSVFQGFYNRKLYIYNCIVFSEVELSESLCGW